MRQRVGALSVGQGRRGRALQQEGRGAAGEEGLYARACEWAGKLKAVTSLNRRVHGPIYQLLMPQMARGLMASAQNTLFISH